jgi:hypothetical protein|tara:strand:+ start:305 stop:496 length:192 start_codon:yes stop_codon:yes gene_type:complete
MTSSEEVEMVCSWKVVSQNDISKRKRGGDELITLYEDKSCYRCDGRRSLNCSSYFGIPENILI